MSTSIKYRNEQQSEAYECRILVTSTDLMPNCFACGAKLVANVEHVCSNPKPVAERKKPAKRGAR